MSEQISIGGENVEVPSWALDATMQQILGMLSQIRGLSVAQTATLSAKLQSTSTNTAGTTQSIEQLRTAMMASLEEMSGEISEQNARSVTGQPATNSLGGSYASGLVAANNDMANSSLMMRGWNGLLDIGGTKLKKFGIDTDSTSLKLLGLGAVVGGMLIGALMSIGNKLVEQATMYRELYASGLLYNTLSSGVANSFSRLTNAALVAGIPIAQMGDLLSKYGRVITKDGIEKFASMSSAVSKFGSNFAMTAGESAEYLAEYMEEQRSAGTLHLMNSAQVADAAMKQMKISQDFSAALGMSTDELRKLKGQTANTVDSMSAKLSIPEEMRARMGPLFDNMTAAISKEAGAGFSEVLTSIVQNEQLAMNDPKIKALRAMGPAGNEIVNSMLGMARGIKSGTLNPEDAAKMSTGLLSTISKLQKDMGGSSILGPLEAVFPGIKQMLSESMMAAEASARASALEGRTKEDLAKGITDTTSAVTMFKDLWSQTVAGLWKNDGLMKAVQNGFIKFSKMLNDGDVVPKLATALQKLINTFFYYSPQLIDGFVMLVDWVAGFVEKLGKYLKFSEVKDGKGNNTGALELNIDWMGILGGPLKSIAMFTAGLVGGAALLKFALKKAIGAFTSSVATSSPSIMLKVGEVLLSGFKNIIGKIASVDFAGMLHKAITSSAAKIPGVVKSVTTGARALSPALAGAASTYALPAAAVVGAGVAGYKGASYLMENTEHGKRMTEYFANAMDNMIETDIEAARKLSDAALAKGDFAGSRKILQDAGVYAPPKVVEPAAKQVETPKPEATKKEETVEENKKSVADKMEKGTIADLYKINKEEMELHKTTNELLQGQIDSLKQVVDKLASLVSNTKRSNWTGTTA